MRLHELQEKITPAVDPYAEPGRPGGKNVNKLSLGAMSGKLPAKKKAIAVGSGPQMQDQMKYNPRARKSITSKSY